VTRARRRESVGPPGGMILESVAKMGLVASKDLGASLRRYLPVATMKLSTMKGWDARWVSTAAEFVEVNGELG
jgi:hypothetical protein